jgi:hypothetical protein
VIKTILVYIPCHKDFAEAISQAKHLRSEFDLYRQTSNKAEWNLEVIISVNNFLPIESLKFEAELTCDEVYYYGENLLADVNISEGFLIALRKHPSHFWILSANDPLVVGGLTLILNRFSSESNLDLLVASESNLDKHLQGKQLLKGEAQNLHLGLISGVIYNTHKMSKYFNVAPFLPWTGWSQLSVIINAAIGEESLVVGTVPRSNLFVLERKELADVGRLYPHSYFGGLTHELMYKRSSISRRRLIRKFVYKNFFLHHLFRGRDKNFEGDLLIMNEHYLHWNKKIAEALIKSEAPFTYCFYRLVSEIPFEKFQKNERLQKIRNYLRDII